MIKRVHDNMISSISFPELANDIRNIYRSDPSRAELLIQQYLKELFKEHSSAEKQALLEQLIMDLESTAENLESTAENLQSPAPASPAENLESPARNMESFGENLESPARNMESPYPQIDSTPESTPESVKFSRLFSQLVGIPVGKEDLSSTELLVKLTPSLATIFNTLNEIVGVINTTLLGRKIELETIRRIIGSTLEEEELDCSTSLKNYLDQIKKAFFVAHQAFQQAAKTKISEMLSELNPDHLETASGGGRITHGFKFGPLRKADLFESYKEKYQACQRWFESGRMIEELLREFEKVCQKIYHESCMNHEE